MFIPNIVPDPRFLWLFVRPAYLPVIFPRDIIHTRDAAPTRGVIPEKFRLLNLKNEMNVHGILSGTQ